MFEKTVRPNGVRILHEHVPSVRSAALGIWVGHAFGARFRGGAERLGGVILILIGLKILLEHLGLISF